MSPNVWKMFTNSPSSLTFCQLQKTTCPDLTIYSWKAFYLIGCPLLLRTNYRCVESLNISVDVAKCLEIVHRFNQFTHFLSVTKNDLSWLNNLFMAGSQLISMSSYAKSKLQMCSATQHQCRRHQMSWNLDGSSDDQSFFVTVQSECNELMCQHFHTFGNVYTDVEWLNTSVVCS